MLLQTDASDFSDVTTVVENTETEIPETEVGNDVPFFTDNSHAEGTVVENATIIADIEGDSLITNGGFETGNLDGWIVDGDAGAAAVEDGAASGEFSLTVQPTAVGTLLTQNVVLETGGVYTIRFTAQGGSADSSVGVMVGGMELFTLDSMAYPDATLISLQIFAGMDFSGVGLSFDGSGAGWTIDDFEVVPVTTGEVIPESETTSGSLEFVDANLEDAHTIAVTPRSGDYLGNLNFILTDSTGIGTGHIDWSFSVENDAIAFLNDGESLTQTYDVTLDDGNGGSVTQAITVTIDGTGSANHAPVATDDAAQIQEDAVSSVAGNVLDNDTDPDAGTLLSVTNAGQFQGEFGTLTLSADGSYVYALDQAAAQHLGQGQAASDSFGYAISDNAVGNPQGANAVVTIQIEGSNDAPVTTDDSADVAEDGTFVATGNLLSNDTDADAGTTLEVLAPGTFEATYGTLTMSADGSYTYVLNNSADAVQALGEGEVAFDSFMYTASDGIAESAGGLSIRVTGKNDAPVTSDDSADVSEDGTLVATGNLLSNDSDADAGTTLEVLAPGSFEATYGTLTMAADGSYTYVLNDSADAVQALQEGEVAFDSFMYTASDGIAESAGSLSIRVTGKNDAPIANADVASAQEDGGPITLAAADLLANDTDVDEGDVKTIVAVSESASGASVAIVDGNIVYAPGAHFQSLGVGATAIDTFTYTMIDGSGAQSSASVAVTVTGMNDAPVLDAPIADQSIKSGSAFTLALGDVFADIDAGDTLTYSSTLANGDALPSWLTFDPHTKTFSGTPGAGDAGNLLLRVNATDSAGASAFDEFSLSVTMSSGKIIIGTNCNDTLYGTEFNDVIDGRGGADIMRGGRGDDKYYVDNSCDVVKEYAGQGVDTIFTTVTYDLPDNVENITLLGSASIGATGNALDNVLTGNQGRNTLAGGAGNDLLDGGGNADYMSGGTGNDTYLVDNTYDKVIEAAGEGSDTVRSTVSFTLGSDVENLILIGSAAINGTGNSSSNLLIGNAAVNTLSGGTGTDILQGLGGNDVLSDTSGRTLFDGGAGNDTLTGNSYNEMFIGGIGNDIITTSTGADIIAFNAGDGQDVVNASTGADNVLSLGGGIQYANLKMTKSGTNLVLKTGGTDQITFKDWYAGNRSVAKLQIFTEAMSGYDQHSTNSLFNDKVEQFNFSALANAFDAAGQVSGWALTNALLSAHLSGSDTAALGGDLAYEFSKNGSLSGIGLTAAQDVLKASQFGTGAQTLRPIEELQQGAIRLS